MKKKTETFTTTLRIKETIASDCVQFDKTLITAEGARQAISLWSDIKRRITRKIWESEFEAEMSLTDVETIVFNDYCIYEALYNSGFGHSIDFDTKLLKIFWYV